MSITFGISDGMFHKVIAGWKQTMQRLYESPLPVLRSEARVTQAKEYESGIITHLDLRLVDVAASPVRLPLNIWRRAILSRHIA